MTYAPSSREYAPNEVVSFVVVLCRSSITGTEKSTGDTRMDPVYYYKEGQ